MRHPLKRFLALFLVLIFCISLFPVSALAEEPEEPAPAEEPVEDPAPAEEPEEPDPAEEPTEEDPSILPEGDEPEAEPEEAEGEDPEELRKPYALSGNVLTFKANGTLDTSNTGGAIEVSAASATNGSGVSCQVQAADGYRLVAVYFGPTSEPISSDVTSTLRAIMPTSAAVFTACFIPDGANMPCNNAAVRLAAPSLGGSYSGSVSANVTKYFNKDGTRYSALNAYSVNAVWRAEDGSNPTTFRIGESYYADITVTINSGWSLGNNFQVVLSTPDGNLLTSGTDFVMERLPFGVSFRSPLYTIPETEGYHNVYGVIATYNASGELDNSLSGGTIQLSTGCAQEGSTISCTVTPNSGYRLAQVLLGQRNGEPTQDVTDTLQGTMQAYNMSFRAVFVADGGKLPAYAAALEIAAPTLGGSYPDGVPVNVTSSLSYVPPMAYPSGFHVENARWITSSSYYPGTILAGHNYRAEFTLVPNDCFYFTDDFAVQLTMPDGGVSTSGFVKTFNADGSIHVISPWYTTSGSTDYHLVMGKAITSDVNGNTDEVNVGGTVTVSTYSALEGQTVSCTVTPNPGYRVAMVLFGGSGSEPVADVTDTLQHKMIGYDAAFTAYFVPEGCRIRADAAALEIVAPTLGGSYPDGVPVDVTSTLDYIPPLAIPSAFHLEDARWTTSNSCYPGTILAGHNYRAEFTLVPNDCFYFADDFIVQLRMPDGSVSTSGFVQRFNDDGSIHVISPWYTTSGSTNYHLVMGKAHTSDINGNTDEVNVGGTVQVSTYSALEGQTVSCTVTPNPGYRVAMVLFGGAGSEPVADVTDTLQHKMLGYDASFDVYFVPEGGRIRADAAALEIVAPAVGGSYPDGVPVDATSTLDYIPPLAIPSAFHLEDARWMIGSSYYPNTILPGHSYRAEFTLVPNDCFYFADDFVVQLRMPDGSVSTSGFVKTFNADGSIHVISPFYTVSGSTSYYHVLGKAFTYDVNGYTDDVNVGGTVRVSTDKALAGQTVSCTVTPNPGYHVAEVFFGSPSAEPIADVTDTLTGTMPAYDAAFQVAFVKDGGKLRAGGAALEINTPRTGGFYSAGAPVSTTPYYSFPMVVAAPTYFHVESAVWHYAGGDLATTISVGGTYYAEILLAPNDDFYFPDDFVVELTLPDGRVVDSFSDVTLTHNSNGTVWVQSPVITVTESNPNVILNTASVGIQMFEEGGDYPQGCPVSFTLPANAHYTVSEAYWYNYADQPSGGIGLAAGTFYSDCKYFTEFNLIPEEGYAFARYPTVTLSPGSVEYSYLNGDGSLHVITSWYALDEEAASQYRRVRGSEILLDADGNYGINTDCGYIVVSNTRPMVGETITFDVVVRDGYRLQQLTVCRYSEGVGDDITESRSYYVDDDEGDVYYCAYFAAVDETIPVDAVTLEVQLPSPGGSFSGSAPADVKTWNDMTQYRVVNAEWYLYENGHTSVPSTIEAGKSYIVRVTLAPGENWRFADSVSVGMWFSDESFQHTSDGDVSFSSYPDGTMVVASSPITIPAAEIDRVELTLTIPQAGGSYTGGVPAYVQVITPNCVIAEVGYWYGTNGGAPSTFSVGKRYCAAFTLTAEEGYIFTSNTQVELLNAGVAQQTLVDSSTIQIITSYVQISSSSYSLSGDYLTFRVNGTTVTEARPGDFVEVIQDIYTCPVNMYVDNVLWDDEALQALTPSKWGFTMPAADVELTAVLAYQEVYVFELEDGVHEVDALHAALLYGTNFSAGYSMEQDVTGDGVNDLRITFREDGSAQVIRLGTVYGEVNSGILPGRIGTILYRFGPQRYDLYLGGVQVTSGNKNNIPVAGGTAKYDPATQTLTLNGVTGVNGLTAQGSGMTGSYFILASGDLTIKGSAELQSNYRGGIYCGGNLTLNGDFTIDSPYGVQVEGDLTVAGGNFKVQRSEVFVVGDMSVLDGEVHLYSSRVTLETYGDLLLQNCYVYVESSSDDALRCQGNMTLTGSTYAYFKGGETAINCSGDLKLRDGYLWAWSACDLGIYAGRFIMEGGLVSANSSWQALYAGSISIPSGYTIIEPANGYIGSDGSGQTVYDPDLDDYAQHVQINGQYVQVTLGVKDLDGNEGVGGKVAFDSGSYAASQSKTLALNTSAMIHAQANTGYRFDHWEGYQGFWQDEPDWEFSLGLSTHLEYWAVFEKLIAVNATNFPDATFRAYVSENIDKDGDGWLTLAERNAVTTIDVSGLGVAKLVGIKYFPELTHLYCYNNSGLTEVDVRQNPKIQILQCYSCSSLTRLYVSGCSELIGLYCYYCALTGINFSGCTNLKVLWCYRNNLSALNLEQCPNLARLDCYYNTNLSELNINSAKLYILFCYGTKLDTLDISACPKLIGTRVNGAYIQTTGYDQYEWKEGNSIYGDLRCNKNAVLEDDLGIPINAVNFPDPVFRADIARAFDTNGNGWLSPTEIANTDGMGFEDEDYASVQGIGFFTEMTYLMIDGAPRLTSLDLRNNTKLTGIEVWGNGLYELKLDGLTELKSISADSNRLTALDVSAFPLEELWVYRNPMTELTLGQQPNLTKLSAYWTDLEELDLSGCPLLLDAYLNGEQTLYENAEHGNYIKYVGPEGGTLYLDADQVVITESTPDHIPGDINGDGVVNNKDVTRLMRYLKDPTMAVNEAALDVNGDGKVTNKDVTRLVRYLKHHDVDIF